MNTKQSSSIIGFFSPLVIRAVEFAEYNPTESSWKRTAILVSQKSFMNLALNDLAPSSSAVIFASRLDK